MPDFSGSYTAKLESQTTAAAPAEHQLSLSFASAMQKSTDANLNGAKLIIWGIADAVAGNGTSRGYFRNEHPNGDVGYGTSESTVSMTATEVTMTGTWRFTGGTGKFANIIGNGELTDRRTSPTCSAGTWSDSYNLG